MSQMDFVYLDLVSNLEQIFTTLSQGQKNFLSDLLVQLEYHL